jgi:hypothetical protein
MAAATRAGFGLSTRLPQLRKAMETLGMLPVTLRRQEFYMQVKFAFDCKKFNVKTSFNDCPI